MQIDNSRRGCTKSDFKSNFERKIGFLLGSYKIEVETAALMNAIEMAFIGIDRDYDDLQARLLSLTLWHIFARDLLWIDCRTKAGNVLSDDVLVTAYMLWRKAERFAENRGLDNVKAALALNHSCPKQNKTAQSVLILQHLHP